MTNGTWDGKIFTVYAQHKKPVRDYRAQMEIHTMGDGRPYDQVILLGTFTTEALAAEAIRRTMADRDEWMIHLEEARIDVLPPVRDFRPRDYLKDPVRECPLSYQAPPRDFFPMRTLQEQLKRQQELEEAFGAEADESTFPECDYCDQAIEPGQDVTYEDAILCKGCAAELGVPVEENRDEMLENGGLEDALEKIIWRGGK